MRLEIGALGSESPALTGPYAAFYLTFTFSLSDLSR